MKQLLSLLIVAICIFTGVKAQHIPDANFAKALHEKYPDCIDEKDNLLPAASSITDLEIDNYGIKNLSGIIGFTKLQTLNLWRDSLTELPTLPETITDLKCSSNQLTALPKLPDDLYKLNCIFNNLTKLPDLPKKIHTLLLS